MATPKNKKDSLKIPHIKVTSHGNKGKRMPFRPKSSTSHSTHKSRYEL